ncbi:MAG: nucleoside hydrolase, partial [Oscillospiraceae bacterium]|nr:nucleoside hydrolase [Oscillospiraceae bacterium]
MDKRKLILDCDPGHDDATAIMMAGNNEKFELLGITTVRGNQTLEKTTRNALDVCQWLGLNDVPVCAGSDRPIVREAPPVEARVHGESGLDGPSFEPLTKKLDARSAIDFIVEQVHKYPNEVTLVITGPMTNVALAFRKDPEIVKLIPEILFMGGSWAHGNVTPAAEFNIWADPEAADIVFRSGIPMVMMGLDVTRQALCYPSVVERMAKIDNRAAKLFVDLMGYFCMTQKKVFGWEGGPLHDPTTIAY